MSDYRLGYVSTSQLVDGAEPGGSAILVLGDVNSSRSTQYEKVVSPNLT